MRLDGAQVASSSAFRTAENLNGYGKIGYDTLGGSWPDVGPTSFAGSLRGAAIPRPVLTPTRIRSHDAARR